MVVERDRKKLKWRLTSNFQSCCHSLSRKEKLKYILNVTHTIKSNLVCEILTWMPSAEQTIEHAEFKKKYNAYGFDRHYLSPYNSYTVYYILKSDKNLNKIFQNLQKEFRDLEKEYYDF